MKYVGYETMNEMVRMMLHDGNPRRAKVYLALEVGHIKAEEKRKQTGKPRRITRGRRVNKVPQQDVWPTKMEK